MSKPLTAHIEALRTRKALVRHAERTRAPVVEDPYELDLQRADEGISLLRAGAKLVAEASRMGDLGLLADGIALIMRAEPMLDGVE